MAHLNQTKPKLVEIFRRHTGVTDARFWHTSDPLRYGTAPVILVDPLGMMGEMEATGTIEQANEHGGYCNAGRLKWYGFTVPTRGRDEVHLATDLGGFPLMPHIKPVVEATLLHELIHYCRKATGGDVNDETAPYAFEKEAYGHVVVRTWNVCMSDVFYRHKLT